ncbi:hypothetical protein CLV32_4666 [Pedobacter duraquae]|uniref:Tetratricopeptide repeat protein n=1 Tax=Pedobacter duraquae TaxID=425511 RepID=A0A4R6IB71_9SPHI|nr:hypothetical protein CLV32_4666 [Pedobacter duraquae]
MVWACSDYGYDDPSSFAPEFFVDQKYSPFFYDSYNSYYLNADTAIVVDNIDRFAGPMEKEWSAYLGGQLSAQQLQFLLFKASKTQIDSVKTEVVANLNAQGKMFFNYLPLAKDCEVYSLSKPDWYDTDHQSPKPEPINLEDRLNNALAATKDPFIRQRLWFQLVRYQFFWDKTGKKTAQAFDTYQQEFPRNLMYYRSLGYLAGAEYAQKRYAQANYHYSLCYNYTWQMYLPSQWSFHPQEEADWNETLKLAKNPEEKITLWHLLGIQYDAPRALQEIVKLNPRSDKLDLLLSRMINIHELESAARSNDVIDTSLTEDIRLVDRIATRTDLAKPLYWHLAAGYLHYLNKEYRAAATWYAKAKAELPAADIDLQAQYKLLKTLLDVRELKKLDYAAEQKLVEPLNWLADLRDNKKSVPNLRFSNALSAVTQTIGTLYLKQNNKLKANCFTEVDRYYVDSIRVDSTEKLLIKRVKTPFEKVMVRYYPLTAPDLFYHQALLAIYKENIPSAMRFMAKAPGLKDQVLLADPFYSRLSDCHDCEFETPVNKYTASTFLQKISVLKANLRSGKNQYQNALMLGGAYYNLSHYGTARQFFQTKITGTYSYVPDDYPKEYKGLFIRQRLAIKYYRIALNNAKTAEQKARAVFLLSKCERNTYYNSFIGKEGSPDEVPPAGQWFQLLKNKFKHTAYYKEVLAECGYFRSYINAQIR